MVFLMIGIGVVVFVGQASLDSNVQRLRESSEATTRILTLDRDVQELRLRVDRYVVSGHDSLLDDVEQIQSRMSATIAWLKSVSDDQPTKDKIEKIAFHLEEHGKQFQSVVEERRIRKDLVQVQLPAIGRRLDGALRSLSENLDAAESQADQLAVFEARSSLSRAEASFLRYFETPDGELVDAGLAESAAAKSGVNAISGFKEDREVLLREIETFKRIALRGVQATRSYLLFRNVVMAGEAAEISHYSRTLREGAEEQRSLISAEVDSNRKNVGVLTSLAIAVGALLAILVAGRLAVATLPPITALTKTFGMLSSGQTLAEIPGTNRSDEIGQMAIAARVFNDQNIRTRELLKDSEQLRGKLEAKTDQLAATNEELDSFAYVASHDLKSPLRGIRQLATWIEEDSGEELSDQTADYLVKLKARVGKMESLLQDLLDFSRVGRANAKAEEVNVKSLLESIIQILDNPNAVGVTWQNDLPIISSVRAPLEQVFLNLIGNAIKHNHRGRDGTVHLTYEPISENGRDVCRFRVCDNGPGIAGKDHDRAFQMYQRVGDASVDGSGMGLAIVKKQIEHFGGTIQLDSRLGHGAIFTFTWPSHLEAKQ